MADLLARASCVRILMLIESMVSFAFVAALIAFHFSAAQRPAIPHGPSSPPATSSGSCNPCLIILVFACILWLSLSPSGSRFAPVRPSGDEGSDEPRLLRENPARVFPPSPSSRARNEGLGIGLAKAYASLGLAGNRPALDSGDL